MGGFRGSDGSSAFRTTSTFRALRGLDRCRAPAYAEMFPRTHLPEHRLPYQRERDQQRYPCHVQRHRGQRIPMPRPSVHSGQRIGFPLRFARRARQRLQLTRDIRQAPRRHTLGIARIFRAGEERGPLPHVSGCENVVGIDGIGEVRGDVPPVADRPGVRFEICAGVAQAKFEPRADRIEFGAQGGLRVGFQGVECFIGAIVDDGAGRALQVSASTLPAIVSALFCW